MPGKQGPTGAPGDAGLLQGTISGTVIAAADSRALSGVTVTLSLSGAGPSDAGTSGTAMTAADGSFKFPNLPIGAYTLSFARTGFLAKSVAVGNSTGGPTILAVTMATDTTAGTDAPTFQIAVSSSNGLTDPFAVGYGTTVTVSVTNLADTSEPTLDASTFTYKWTVSTGITSSNETGAYTFNTTPTSTSTSAAFNTMTLAQTKGVEVNPLTNPIDGGPLGYFARLGVMGINPDETGLYSVGITVSDKEGHNYSLSQGIQSTWQTASVTDVPVGVPVYLQGNTFASPNWMQTSGSQFKWPNTSWTWSFTSCTAPSGAAITCPTLNNATAQYPYFVPAAAGTYSLSVNELSSYADAGTTGLGLNAGPGPGGSYGNQTSTLNVYVGNWVGVMNSNPSIACPTCHSPGGPAPDMFTPWANTNHASAMQRKVDGLATSHFGESCLECHTTGWSEVATAQTAANGGFFYEMNTETFGGNLWQYPSPMTPTSYSTMATDYPNLGYLGGIQCENCHGPAGGPASGHPGNLAGDPQQITFLNARASWDEQVCASCHEEAKNHMFPGQWALTGHGNLQVAINEAAVESKTTSYGGGANPQKGSQLCGRCHSAQGFAHYVNMLKNGASDRYDFITTDDQKLAADGGNAPTTAWLSSIGLNAAQVQSQTCQTCHDPHSNGAYSAAYGSDAGIGPVDCTQQSNNTSPACMQLRIYDQLPHGLPNGIGPISGVGEGALCMACHNGFTGEHTDLKNTAPYAETPSMSQATEALFGFNTFFMPEYTPSPHLAIQDTCSGCHVKLPTAAEADAGYASNHQFVTDLTICQNCHGSSAVDGNAIQTQVKSELATLASTITTAVQTHVMNASAAGGLCVQVTKISDPNCVSGSCASSQVIPAVRPFPTPASNVWIPMGDVTKVVSSGTSTSVTLTVSPGINIPYFDQQTLALVSTTSSSKSLSVPIYTILTGVAQASCTAGGAYNGGVVGTIANQLFPATDNGAPTQATIPAKAIWNYTELNGEASYGIHNLPWTSAVIGNTMAQLENYKP